VEAGVDSGPGYKVRGTVSGPLTDDIRFRLSGSYMDTDGFINNTFLGEEADPVKDASARLRMIWDVTETFSADFRLSYSMLDTQALYFRIAPEADDLLPVRVNNPGNNEREFISSSLKLEWVTDAGTFTAITAYDDVNEVLSGDQFNFLPRAESSFNSDPFGGFIKFLTGDEITDLSQNQYLEVESISQEVRFASPEEEAPALDRRRLRHRHGPLHLHRQPDRPRLRRVRREEGLPSLGVCRSHGSQPAAEHPRRRPGQLRLGRLRPGGLRRQRPHRGELLAALRQGRS
jgi:hypothetical protein